MKLAEAIRAKGKSCAHGGAISCDKGCFSKGGEATLKEGYSEIAKSIRAKGKKLSDGGMIEEDDNDWEEMTADPKDDDFLSFDGEENEPSEDDKRKARLKKVFSRK